MPTAQFVSVRHTVPTGGTAAVIELALLAPSFPTGCDVLPPARAPMLRRVSVSMQRGHLEAATAKLQQLAEQLALLNSSQAEKADPPVA